MSTYSGHTEETLAALQRADTQGAEIAVITSGGLHLPTHRKKGITRIVIPGGNPPRSMFGYSFVQLLKLLSFYGLVDAEVMDVISHAIPFLERHSGDLRAAGTELANFLYGKIPVVYAADGFEGVAIRFRQQLNENSKMIGYTGMVPEMNHNELVGWAGGNDQMAVVFLRNETDDPRIRKRMEINQKIVKRSTPHVRELWSRGSNAIERALYLICLGDWASFDLSVLNGVDVMEVDVIEYLKSELAKFGS